MPRLYKKKGTRTPFNDADMEQAVKDVTEHKLSLRRAREKITLSPEKLVGAPHDRISSSEVAQLGIGQDLSPEKLVGAPHDRISSSEVAQLDMAGISNIPRRNSNTEEQTHSQAIIFDLDAGRTESITFITSCQKVLEIMLKDIKLQLKAISQHHMDLHTHFQLLNGTSKIPTNEYFSNKFAHLQLPISNQEKLQRVKLTRSTREDHEDLVSLIMLLGLIKNKLTRSTREDHEDLNGTENSWAASQTEIHRVWLGSWPGGRGARNKRLLLSRACEYTSVAQSTIFCPHSSGQFLY
ncbi:hypothetical protein QE152_g24281 [Popillia japonica]|uniref:Uncharacterized protein n=1 Tax=Popillia japonica TaxID=7064 RepID=A0AAW1KC73_POPJA